MPPTLEAIWNEFADKLGWFIRARVSDPATAEDFLQDVFVNIQGRLDTLDDPARKECCQECGG
jgi:DNA-directed RNA polymerase specialized sigma24 family protein